VCLPSAASGGEAFDGLIGLSGADLGADVPPWKEKRKFGLFLLLSELVHHGGQDAYLRHDEATEEEAAVGCL
jgi:hypothetical protein